MLVSASAFADALVTIILDDVGDRLDYGRRAVALPGAVTLSILPRTPHAPRLAHEGYASGKEIMLHQPMEAIEPRPLGPGGVSLHMTHAEFRRIVQDNLAAVPHVRGVNNHMGSLLTRHPGHMAWLMDELRARGDLYFIDSRTTPDTVALMTAREHGLPSAPRDVFLDTDRSPERMRAQWALLLEKARTRGHALGIGHVYPETLALLERELPTLEEKGFHLVPASALIAESQKRSPDLWHASLSPSPTAAKSSKPSPSSTSCAAPASKC